MCAWKLFEGQRERELRETRERWSAVSAQWARIPLLEHGVSSLALGYMGHLLKVAGRLPNGRIFTPLLDATIELLEGGELGTVEPDWQAIEADVSAAVNFRRLMTRRQRWASDFETRQRVVQGYLLGFWKRLIAAMPANCFREQDDQITATFDVPLCEVLERPGDVITSCVMFAFAEEFERDEMFEALRGQMRRNLLRASGLSPEADLADVRGRVVMPYQSRIESPTELARAYLEYTPFLAVFEAPAPFSLPDETRFEHGHILGGTGAGKTQLLQRMIHADLVTASKENRSVVVIDSQGDLINKLVRLDLFSPWHENSLAERLVLIDPSDIEHPPALNLFDAHLDRVSEYGLADRERVLNGVVEMYEQLFGDMLGAELTQKQGVVFRYLARLMVTIPGATIHTLMELMEDGKAFKPQMAQLEGSARHFFETEFFHPSFAATKKQILRRLWGVLSTPTFERMFAQRDNKLDLFDATRDGKIILISTAKDLLKRDGSALMGRFFINLLAQAALERSVLPASERTPTFVYVDEAQEYFDAGIETILQQARKYRIGLVAAHQSLDQASTAVRSALLANTSFKCAGGVSAKDARALADEMQTTGDFILGMRRRGAISEFAAWVKHETPHAIRLSVPLGYLEAQPTLEEEEYDALLEVNRERYCGSLEEVLSAFNARIVPVEFDEALTTPEAGPPTLPVDPVWPGESQPQPHIQAERVAARATRPRELGKGGAKHRYLQNLVKGLAEEQGFRTTIEAPIRDGQVDVLLEREGLTVAVEVSVTTPVEWEKQNLRKCLAGMSGPVVLVLAKGRAARSYRSAVLEGLSEAELRRVSVMHPEDLPAYFASLAPAEPPPDSVVRGYRVKVTRTAISPEEAAARRDAIARLLGQSMGRVDRAD